MKRQISDRGYTLVELLVVIIILVSIGTIISSILTSVLRSSDKSITTENVRVNGDFAITQMSKMITYAKEFEGVSTDGSSYSASCVTSGGNPPAYKFLKIKSFDDGTTIFACDDQVWAAAPYNYPATIASESSSSTAPIFLADPSMDATCHFNCSQTDLSSPIEIDIFLDLKAKSQTLFSENQADVPFQTSVIIRNSASP
jgi:prepilin-type N-terminal cleavage/methylation domain-containing protein